MNISPYISAEVNDGIRGFHVIYRPIADSETRRRSNSVRTKWFPIADQMTQSEAWTAAVEHAAEVNESYPEHWPKECPYVDWQDLAKRKGEKLRKRFSHPTRNPTDENRIREMVDRGYSAVSIAEEFGVSRQTAYKWRKRYAA